MKSASYSVRALSGIVLLLLTQLVFSQKPTIHTDTLGADCIAAKTIKASGRHFFRVPLNGPGNHMEIRAPQSSPHYFSQEHNSGWIKFVAPTSGFLSFMIMPFNKAADFDFVLFELESVDQCPTALNTLTAPARANIARNDTTIGEKTGLSPEGGSDYRRQGVGNRYSNLLEVKKGDAYCLVVDDVYGSEKGFSLFFTYYKTIDLQGEVLAEDNTPVKAKVTLEEPQSGMILGSTETEADGSFTLNTFSQKGSKKEHTLAIEPLEKGQLYEEKSLTVEELSNPDKRFSFKLRRIEKDQKLITTDINFVGNKAIPVNSSVPTLDRLKRILKRNRTMEIVVEGHVNDPFAASDCDSPHHQELSDARAAYVVSFLKDHGIEAERTSSIGYSCHQMLYPQAVSEMEQHLNRRVEIKVVHE